MAEWGTESMIPSPVSGYLSSAGEPVSQDTAFGLPAAMQAIRMSSTTVASLELASYRGMGSDKVRVGDPAPLSAEAFDALGMSLFDWLSDMQSSIEGFANAYARKARDTRGRVVALDPVHPSNIHVRREDGRKVFDVWDGSEYQRGLTSRDIFHVRGFSVGPGVAAPSPVQVHRNPLGVALAQESFVGDHFRNDASPSVVLKFGKTGLTAEQAQEWAEKFDERHAGRGRRRRTAAIGASDDITVLPVSLKDAQFIEGQAFSVEQIARIFNWPAWALDKTEQMESQTTTEEKTSQLLVFYLLPRLKRLEAALKADPDIYGPGEEYPELLTDHFIRVDAKTKAEMDAKYVQFGIRMRDEVRADYGWSELPGGAGKTVPETPAGATGVAVPNAQD